MAKAYITRYLLDPKKPLPDNAAARSAALRKAKQGVIANLDFTGGEVRTNALASGYYRIKLDTAGFVAYGPGAVANLGSEQWDVTAEPPLVWLDQGDRISVVTIAAAGAAVATTLPAALGPTALTIKADDPPGKWLAAITGVPAGSTAKITPKSGLKDRIVVVGGDGVAKPWGVYMGLEARTIGSFVVTISAEGALDTDLTITVEAGIAPVAPIAPPTPPAQVYLLEDYENSTGLSGGVSSISVSWSVHGNSSLRFTQTGLTNPITLKTMTRTDKDLTLTPLLVYDVKADWYFGRQGVLQTYPSIGVQKASVNYVPSGAGEAMTPCPRDDGRYAAVTDLSAAPNFTANAGGAGGYTLYHRPSNAGIATGTYIDAMATQPADTANYMIYLDDGYRSQQNIIIPIFDLYGIKCAIGCPNERFDQTNYWQTDAALAAQGNGHRFIVDRVADSPYTNEPDLAGVLASANVERNGLIARGLNVEDSGSHGMYPNGAMAGNPFFADPTIGQGVLPDIIEPAAVIVTSDGASPRSNLTVTGGNFGAEGTATINGNTLTINSTTRGAFANGMQISMPGLGEGRKITSGTFPNFTVFPAAPAPIGPVACTGNGIKAGMGIRMLDTIGRDVKVFGVTDQATFQADGVIAAGTGLRCVVVNNDHPFWHGKIPDILQGGGFKTFRSTGTWGLPSKGYKTQNRGFGNFACMIPCASSSGLTLQGIDDIIMEGRRFRTNQGIYIHEGQLADGTSGLYVGANLLHNLCQRIVYEQQNFGATNFTPPRLFQRDGSISFPTSPL